MNYLLFNPLANNKTGEVAKEEALKSLYSRYENIEVTSVVDLDVDAFLAKLSKDDVVIIVGGDGTLNRFANAVANKELPCGFYLYKGGTGNDFLHDVENEVKDGLLYLNDYVKDLPIVIINDKEYRFLNGIGFGIDGTACEVADKQKAEGKKKINYAGISIGLMFKGYKCPDATVVVDGVEKKYHRVWLASAMNGRYYGGGMLIAPNQERKSDKVTSVIFHGSNKLKTLFVFPSIFKGAHVKHKKIIDIREGKEISVTFSLPTALQIDGETFSGVTSYRVIKK